MQEQGRDLSVDIGLENEGGHVGERNDRRRVEKEEDPDALVVLVEHKGEHDDKQDGDIGHQDVKDDVRSPVAGEGHA